MVKPFNSDTVSVIANFAKLTNAEQNLLLGFRHEDGLDSEEDSDEQYESVMLRLYHFIMQEKPYFEKRIRLQDLFRVFVVEPRQSFDRIRVQSGAFLISAFHRRFERIVVQSWNERNPVNPLYDHYELEVPYEAKKTILDELRFFNITHETMYSSLDIAASAVNAEADTRLGRS